MSTTSRTSAGSWRRFDTDRIPPRLLATLRVMLLVSGIVSVILGIMVLAWPGATLAVIALLFGLYFIVTGLVRVGLGIFTKGVSAGLRTLTIVFGVLMIAVGVFAVLNPLASLQALAIVIGITWIVEGIVVLVESGGEGAPTGWSIALGVIGLLAGLAVLMAPIAFMGLLVVFGGVALIVLGVVQVVRAFGIGRARRA